MTMTRAKFRCDSVKQSYWSKTQKIYEFYAVCQDETPENERYHQATPNGKLEITVDNPAVEFTLGQEYYLDFTPAVKEEPKPEPDTSTEPKDEAASEPAGE